MCCWPVDVWSGHSETQKLCGRGEARRGHVQSFEWSGSGLNVLDSFVLSRVVGGL